MIFQLTLMADIWEILELYNNYSLATPLHPPVQPLSPEMYSVLNG